MRFAFHGAVDERKDAKHPRSPSCKPCPLDIAILTGDGGVGGKPLRGPPGEYGRKSET